MRNDRLPQAQSYIKKHKRFSIWHKLLMSMAVIVVFVTTYALILPAITMESKTVCGKTEHTHTDECYVIEKVLTCSGGDGQVVSDDSSKLSGDNSAAAEDDLTSGEAVEVENNTSAKDHEHTDECYTEVKKLVCDIEEHTHTDACYPNKDNANTAEGTSNNVSKAAADEGEYGDLSNYIVDVCIAEEEKNVFEAVFASISALANDILNGVTEDGAVTYDPISDTFDTRLEINFAPKKEDVLNNNYLFTYNLPAEIVELIDIELGEVKRNDDEATHKFDYKFMQREDGSYYIEVQFVEEYIASIGADEQLTGGYIKFETHISSDAVQTDDSIKLKFDGDVVLDIPADEISYLSNSTANASITTTKSGKYDSKSNTLTYEVVVYSNRGTNNANVEISDAISSLKGLNITDADITVNEAVVTYWIAKDGSYTNNYKVNKSDTTVTPLAYHDDTANGSYSMTLPPLGEGITTPDDYGQSEECKAYVITYTYSLDDLEVGDKADLKNTIDASASPESGTPVSSTTNNAVYVEKTENKAVTKTAYVSGESIKWTIKLDGEQTTIPGSTLTDDMFSELAEGDITISPETGYVLDKDADGKITGIVFEENCESAYTIEYSTKLTNWNKETFTNTATLTDAEGGTIGDTASVGGNAGSVSKSNGTLVSINEDGSRTVSWTITFNVPEGGIPSGLTVKDDLGNARNGHYYTNSDAEKIFAALDSSQFGGKYNTIVFKKSDGTSYTAASASDLPADTTFVSFEFATTADIVYDSEAPSFSYTYTSTINPGDNSSVSYYNSITVPDRWVPNGDYYYEKKVIKTDGSNKSGTTDTRNDDGIVTWRVKINVDSGFNEMVVTDNLPEDVDLTALKMSVGNSYSYNALNLDGTPSTVNSFNVSSTVSGQAVVTTISSDGSTVPENGVIYLEYSCKIKDEKMPENALQVFELANTVDVKIDGAEYDGAGQTQNLTVNTGADDKLPIEKSQVWDNSKQQISASVELNPSGEKYGSDGYFGFTDTLSYDDGTGCSPTYKSQRVFSIDYSSVKLYYAKQYTATGEDGKPVIKLEKLEEVPTNLWSYNYKTEKTLVTEWDNSTYNQVKNIISAKFPDETPLIFEYAYNLSFVKHNSDPNVGASNVAKIEAEIDGNSSKSESNETWQSSGSSGGIGIQKIYTLYKASEGNLNELLSGAVFELYEYKKDVDKYQSTGIRFTTGDGVSDLDDDGSPDPNGMLKVDYNKSYNGIQLQNNTLYYLVEVLPPVGYELPRLPERLYFYAEEKNAESNLPDTLPSGCVNLSSTSPVVYMQNSALGTTSLAVNKQWLYKDIDGNVTEDTPGSSSVDFKVKRKYKLRADDAEAKRISANYNITGSYTGSGGISEIKAGTPLKLTITKEIWAVFTASINIGGETLNLSNESSGWVGDEYTYTFIPTDDLDITGTVDGNGIISITLTEDESYFDPSEYTSDTAWSQTGTISADNGWSATITDLPKSGIIGDSYADFVYSVEEATALDGYETEYVISGSNTTIKNIRQEKKLVNVVKKWLDSQGSEVIDKTGAINVKLLQKIYDRNDLLGNTANISFSIKAYYADFYDYLQAYPINSQVSFDVLYKQFDGTPAINKDGTDLTYTKSEFTIDGVNYYKYSYSFTVDKDSDISGDVNWSISTANEYVSISTPVSSGGDVGDISSAVPLKINTIGTYSLSSGNGWQETVDVTDLVSSGTYVKDNGTSVDAVYIYCFEEDEVPGYTAQYSTDRIDIDSITGTTPGVVTITNSPDSGYEPTLPETGGSGTHKFSIGGLLIIFISVYLLYKKRKCGEGVNYSN